MREIAGLGRGYATTLHRGILHPTRQTLTRRMKWIGRNIFNRKYLYRY